MDMVRGLTLHTGGPFSSMDFTYVLYNDFLKFDPDDDSWFDRDRFVLSLDMSLLFCMQCYI